MLMQSTHLRLKRYEVSCLQDCLSVIQPWATHFPNWGLSDLFCEMREGSVNLTDP